MYRSSAKRLSAFIVSVGLFLAGTSALLAAQKTRQASAPRVMQSVKNKVSAPLRDYRVQGPVVPGPSREVKNKQLPSKGSQVVSDPAVQRAPGLSAPGELSQFEGGSDAQNESTIGFRVAPPDTNGDVGPNDYVQYINLIVNMYDKSGGLNLGPLPGNAFWADFGDACETSNDGDPIVLYDQLADRWFVSQFAFPNFPSPPYIQCIAVSVTGDPTGSYYQYQFNLPDTYLNDYPKFGVWPDAYYGTANGFDVFGGGFAGLAWAFDRSAMLDGLPATLIQFDTGPEGGVLPSDLDGMTLPPGFSAADRAGGVPPTPNYFMTWEIDPSRLLIWEFHVDFATPANSTFTGPAELLVDPFTYPVCGSFRDQCVPQLDSSELLETLSQATMFRLAYRNFGDHQSLVTNQTVDADDGGQRAGVRWYELQIKGAPVGGGASTPWVVHQQGTYAPDDGNHRWMGSIAQDQKGNMALGYSISSSEMFPAIAITGRLEGDPLGLMGAENIWLAGTGSQEFTSSRWGDYSMMAVDPVDDCTFWYTNEYYTTTGSFDWHTRIGSFKFPSCTSGETGTLEGTVSDGANPIQGATVTAGPCPGPDCSETSTDAAGHYQFERPVGTYDVTASKFGFFPASADDVEVTDGGTTTQDFVLEAAPAQIVNGTVKDAATGWPLYAKIQISALGFPGATLWTDPVTGYYGISLVEGTTYTFLITAVSQGYEPGGGPLFVGLSGSAPFLVKNWTLTTDAIACNAPGYTLDVHGLYENFDGGEIPPNWQVVNNSTDGGPPWIVFEGPDPCGLFSGNDTGGTGPYAIVNSNCDAFTTADTDLITPSVDLSSVGSPAIRFNSDFSILDPLVPQLGEVDYSIDGGATWTNVLVLDDNQPGPDLKNLPIPGAANEANVQVRFHFEGFWAWWWQVDNVLLGEGNCVAGTGGLVVGNVTDASNGNGLNGATVQNVGGGSTKTFATPDPNQPDGLYILYAEAGSQDFEASFGQYQPDQGSTLVVPGGTVRLDFALLSGNLSASPTALNARVDPGGTQELVLEMTNSGAAPATFELIEINAPLLNTLTRGFASEALRKQAVDRLPHGPKGPDHFARSTRDIPAMPNRPQTTGRPNAVGDVVFQFDSEITYGWGVATIGTNIWLSNLGVAGGDDQDYEYTGTGTQTGNTIDDSGIGEWAADGAQDIFNRTFWRVAVGGDNCIHELDPASHTQTGNSICGSPWAGISQRGLAFDPVNDAFFIGGWNEGVIYHIDRDGNVLDSAFVGLSIAGLAYSASNGHLLVMENIPGGNDITVLDALDNYNVITSYPILDDGAPAITPFGGAGAEFDCLGNLWVIDQNTQVVYSVETGEEAGCEVDIPWFSADPTSGTVPPGAGAGGTNPFPVTGSFDSTGLFPGLQLAQLAVKTDTPYQVPSIPVTLTVRFLDVPDSNPFQAFIYGAAGAGVIFGGPPPCPAGVLYFCPDGIVTRADMAGYIFRAVNGADTPPPVYQNIFQDVLFNDYNSFYIQGISEMGVTAGCSADPPLYCPNDPVQRDQMAAFIWRGQHGDEPPPACTPPGIFGDVPCPSLFADYVEAIYAEGITAGCNANPLLYCPDSNITNGQMATFLVKAFDIPYLP